MSMILLGTLTISADPEKAVSDQVVPLFALQNFLLKFEYKMKNYHQTEMN